MITTATPKARVLLCCLAILAFYGCQRQAPAQPTGLTMAAGSVTPPGALPAPPALEAREIRLTLGRSLEKCPNMLVRFPYDESQPLPQDAPEIRALAACLNSSPYQSVKLRLVGRADAAGSEEYNLELGRRRAEYVKAALVNDGVDAGRIETESQGKQSAGEEGTAPGYDRRVDIVQLAVINPI